MQLSEILTVTSLLISHIYIFVQLFRKCIKASLTLPAMQNKFIVVGYTLLVWKYEPSVSKCTCTLWKEQRRHWSFLHPISLSSCTGDIFEHGCHSWHLCFCYWEIHSALDQEVLLVYLFKQHKQLSRRDCGLPGPDSDPLAASTASVDISMSL